MTRYRTIVTAFFFFPTGKWHRCLEEHQLLINTVIYFCFNYSRNKKLLKSADNEQATFILVTFSGYILGKQSAFEILSMCAASSVVI